MNISFQNVLRPILSPLGFSFAFMHWIVVLFAFLGDKPEPGFNNSTYLLYYLVRSYAVETLLNTALLKIKDLVVRKLKFRVF